MKWESSSIGNQVIPITDSAVEKLGTASNAAQGLFAQLEPMLPERFPERDAIFAAGNGLRLAHEGASSITGVLVAIGNGMTDGDSNSVRDLLNKFRTQKEALLKSKEKSMKYDNTSKRPTNVSYNKYLMEKYSINDIPETNTGIGILSQIYNTGAKLAVDFTAGTIAGVLEYTGDLLGGIGGSLAVLCGQPELAYNITSFCDFGGKFTQYAAGRGVNIDSAAFTGGKAAGKIGCAVAVTLLAGPGATGANACIAGMQSYAKTYRGSIDAKIKEVGKGNLSGKDYNTASSAAALDGTLSAISAFVTQGFGEAAKGAETVGELFVTGVGSGVFHAASNAAHQNISQRAGIQKDIDKGEVIFSAIGGAAGTIVGGLVSNDRFNKRIIETGKTAVGIAKKYGGEVIDSVSQVFKKATSGVEIYTEFDQAVDDVKKAVCAKVSNTVTNMIPKAVNTVSKAVTSKVGIEVLKEIGGQIIEPTAEIGGAIKKSIVHKVLGTSSP